MRLQCKKIVLILWISEHIMQYNKIQKKDGMSDRKPQYLVKVIVIGDSGVGKTNLITRFCQNKFKDNYVATIGVDFKIKSLMIKNKKIKMQIWDTAGQERFRNITQTYYKGASGIILTYSISDSTSFTNIERWIAQIETNSPEDVSKILVATKLDLNSERSVSTELGRELANRHGIKFIEVSAKTGEQVTEVFEMIGDQIDDKREELGLHTSLYGSKKEVLRRSAWQPAKKNCDC